MKKQNTTLMAVLFVITVVLVIMCAYLYVTRVPRESIPVYTAPVTTSTPTTNVVPQAPTTTQASATTIEFPTDVAFSFPNHPGIIFKVLKVSKVLDPNADYTHFAEGMENPALLTVTLQITNNSNEKLNANYLQVLYSQYVSPEERNLVAPYYIHTSYESDPMSQITVTPTFIIPNDRTGVSLVTGIYPPKNYSTAEDMLSRSADAYTIDFVKKEVSHLEG